MGLRIGRWDQVLVQGGMWTCAGVLCPARSAKRAAQCRMRAPHIRMVQTMMKMAKIIMTNGHDDDDDDDDGHNDDIGGGG